MTDERMKELIMGHTTKEIRSAANALGVTLGYSAGRKEDAAGEIVAWMRHNNVPHYRLIDDLDAVMSGVGICSGGKDDEDRAPLIVLAEDGTCVEWEGQGTCDTSASSAA